MLENSDTTQRRTGDGEFKNTCIWLKVELVSGIIVHLPHKAGFDQLDDNLTNYDKEKKHIVSGVHLNS